MQEKKRNILNELLVDVFNHILDIEQNQLKKNGVNLSMNEVHVLEAVTLVKEPKMGDIAEKLRITVGSLTTSVNRLVKKGYIVRRDDEKDRRKVLLELTESAQKVLKVHEEFHNHLIDSLFLDMKIEDEVVLIKSLENILSFFKLKLN